MSQSASKGILTQKRLIEHDLPLASSRAAAFAPSIARRHRGLPICLFVVSRYGACLMISGRYSL